MEAEATAAPTPPKEDKHNPPPLPSEQDRGSAEQQQVPHLASFEPTPSRSSTGGVSTPQCVVVGRRWLVCVDDSEYANWCVDLAVHLMDRQHDQLHLINSMAPQLMLLGGIAPPPVNAFQYMLEAEQLQIKQCKQMLYRYQNHCISDGLSRDRVVLIFSRSSDAGDNIVNYIDKANIDVCVVGRRGMGAFKRFFLGSTSNYVVKNAKCNVLVVKAPDPVTDKHLETERLSTAIQQQSEQLQHHYEQLHDGEQAADLPSRSAHRVDSDSSSSPRSPNIDSVFV